VCVTYALCSEAFTEGDVIGCFLDLDNGVVGFSKNGAYLGEAFRFDVGGAGRQKQAYFPAIALKQATVGCDTPLRGLAHMPYTLSRMCFHAASRGQISSDPIRALCDKLVLGWCLWPIG
jgi:hypothetical protein